MDKEALNRKKEDLRSLGRRELVNQICSYPDQDRLNENKAFPTGNVARGIRDRGYVMSDKQYHTLVQNFAQVLLSDNQVQRAEGVPDQNAANHIYEIPFYTGCPVTDPEEAGKFVKGLDLGEDLGADFETYMQTNTVKTLSWDFKNQNGGVVRLVTGKPLTPEQQMITKSFIRFQQSGSLGARLVSEGFMDPYISQEPFLEKIGPVHYAGSKVPEPPKSLPVITEKDLEFAGQMTLDMFGLT